MNVRWMLAVALAMGICGCAKMQGQSGKETASSAEPGETKIALKDAPAAVRTTIEHELVGAELEDIARKEKAGKTIYETDIIRNGQKWEVNVGEDGSIVSKIKEGDEQEKEEKSEAQEAGWREKFDVS